MPDADPPTRILLPCQGDAVVEAEADATTNAGMDSTHPSDAARVFEFEVPHRRWHGTVLALAGGHAAGLDTVMASTVAVGALEAAMLHDIRRFDVASHDWQHGVTRMLGDAFARARTEVTHLLESSRSVPSPDVSLAEALLIGDWLCTAAVGDTRIYHLAGHVLSPISVPDRLGAPTMQFTHMHAGDLVLVCSAAVSREVGLPMLRLLLDSRRPVSEISARLVQRTARQEHEVAASVCIVRVGRLFARHLPAPRKTVTAISSCPSSFSPAVHPAGQRLIGSTILVGLFLILAMGGEVLLAPPPPIDVQLIRPHAALPPPVPPAPPRQPTPELPTTAGAVDAAPEPRATARASEPRLSLPQQLMRAFVTPTPRESGPSNVMLDEIDSMPGLRALQLASESAIAAQVAEQKRRERDSTVAADRARFEAQMVRNAEAITDSLLAAEARRQSLLQAGRAMLDDWMTDVVQATNARVLDAPVFAVGPPGFARFVRNAGPGFGTPLRLSMTVTETMGQATAAWTARWRTSYSTTTTRRMKAVATLARSGDGWRLRGWRIIEGGP